MYVSTNVSRNTEKNTGCGSTKNSPCLYCRAAGCAIPPTKESPAIEGHPRLRLLYSPEVISFLAECFPHKEILVATSV